MHCASSSRADRTWFSSFAPTTPMTQRPGANSWTSQTSSSHAVKESDDVSRGLRQSSTRPAQQRWQLRHRMFLPSHSHRRHIADGTSGRLDLERHGQACDGRRGTGRSDRRSGQSCTERRVGDAGRPSAPCERPRSSLWSTRSGPHHRRLGRTPRTGARRTPAAMTFRGVLVSTAGRSPALRQHSGDRASCRCGRRSDEVPDLE